MTQICVGKLSSIGSDNGLSPRRRHVIIWTNAGILLILTLRIKFSESLSGIHTFSFKKMHLKMSSAKSRPFCLGFNVLRWMVMRKAPRYATGACHKGVLISRADYITGSRLAPFVKISWSPFSTLLPRQDMGCLSLSFNIISVSFSMLALAGSMLNYCQLDLGNTLTLVKFQSKPLRLVFNGMNLKM